MQTKIVLIRIEIINNLIMEDRMVVNSMLVQVIIVDKDNNTLTAID
jgi:hypothetical protein